MLLSGKQDDFVYQRNFVPPLQVPNLPVAHSAAVETNKAYPIVQHNLRDDAYQAGMLKVSAFKMLL